VDQEQAFLQAIRARPGSKAERLVYADWLTDKGDPRGDFIRLHVHGTPRRGVDPPADRGVERAEPAPARLTWSLTPEQVRLFAAPPRLTTVGGWHSILGGGD